MSANQLSQIIGEPSDAELVSACLTGRKDAYGKIVERYQRLLCSIAYSSVGCLSTSEEVAQEAFIEGWKKLSKLKEPEKLRSWLCGILRFKVSHRLRKEVKEPTRRAESLDELALSAEMDEPPVEEKTMRNEEHALLWQALKQLPENYREPLVLYYREHQSIEHVAGELDLSEDAVKQRLSRGRKMLQEKMMTFVEDQLVRSAPGKVFTMGVLAALPTLAPTAKAAVVGATVAKASSVTKTAGVAAFLASVSGFISTFFMFRANMDQARTVNERKNVVKNTVKFFGGAIGFVLLLVAMLVIGIHNAALTPYMAVASQLLILAFTIWYPLETFRMLTQSAQLRADERVKNPDAFDAEKDRIGSKTREYISEWKLLGIPLVHMQFSTKEKGEKPAVGWIAFGDKAYGVLFAFGGYAVGAVSVGIISVGVVTCSCIGVGLIGMGTVGIGVLGLGAVAIGYKAFASLSALGLSSAWGPGFAIARDGAIGKIAYAGEVNNELAAQIASLQQVSDYHTYVLAALSIMVIVPVVIYAQAIRKRMRLEKR